MLYPSCERMLELFQQQIENHCLLSAALEGHVQKISCKVNELLLNCVMVVDIAWISGHLQYYKHLSQSTTFILWKDQRSPYVSIAMVSLKNSVSVVGLWPNPLPSIHHLYTHVCTVCSISEFIEGHLTWSRASDFMCVTPGYPSCKSSNTDDWYFFGITPIVNNH